MATAPMSDRDIGYTVRRIYRLPGVIEAAERKLAGLYREAARYGMDDLLQDPGVFDRAWDREITAVKLEALIAGREYSIGAPGQ